MIASVVGNRSFYLFSVEGHIICHSADLAICRMSDEYAPDNLYILLHPLLRIMSRHTFYTPVLLDESLQVIM